MMAVNRGELPPAGSTMRQDMSVSHGGIFVFYVSFKNGLFGTCFLHSPLLAGEMGPSSFGHIQG